MSSLNLGVIGNCTFGALVDDAARIVWCCLPRFDADPVFCSLIDDDVNAGAGFFAIELLGAAGSVQRYRANTAILETEMVDVAGNRIVVTDFAPRFQTRGRTFRPTTLVRRIRHSRGSPRIRIRVRPRFNYGARAPESPMAPTTSATRTRARRCGSTPMPPSPTCSTRPRSCSRSR